MKVLIGMAESQDAVATVSGVRRFPWPAETYFRLLSVVEKVHPSVLELMGATVHDVQRKADLRASATASMAADYLSQAGFTAEAETVEGDPKVEIVESAKRWRADLIVVGSVSGGRLEKLLLGSVANAVVRNAHCSVLVIRAVEEESEA